MATCWRCNKQFDDEASYLQHMKEEDSARLRDVQEQMQASASQQIRRVLMPQMAVTIAVACATTHMSVADFMVLYREAFDALSQSGPF